MVLPRDLEIRHLQALDAVAATGTFGRAAERLGYTQSAISQQIAALERAIGEPLFDRPGGPRPVQLTPIGAMLVGQARAVLERVDMAAASIDRFRAGLAGRIDVGTFQSVTTGLLPSVLDRLRRGRPELEARLYQSDDEDELAQRVVEGHLDVTFLLNLRLPELEVAELFVDPFVVIAPASAAADLDGRVPVDRLHGEPMVGEGDSCCQRLIDEDLRAAGVAPDYVFRTNDNGAITAMVRAGMGMAVVPQLLAEQDHDGLVVRALDPPITPRTVTLAWRRGRTLSPCAREFVELAREMTSDLRDAA